VIRVLYAYYLGLTREIYRWSRIFLNQRSSIFIAMECDDDSMCISADAEDGNAEFRWKDHVRIQCRKGNNFVVFTCNYCSADQKAMTGGCSRFKTHLLGGVGVRRCLGAPDSLILSLRAAVESRSRARTATLERSASVTEAEREDRRNRVDRLRESLSCGSAQVNKRWKQSTLEECDGAARLEIAQQDVARMWYRCSMPFQNVGFAEVVNAFDSVCRYGAETGQTTFALPSAPSLRNSRLDAEVARIEKQLLEHSKTVETYGISLQSDGKDNMARRHLVDIITTSPAGAQFREVIDVSGQSRDAI
jgi:hypothetical protein